MMAILPDLDIIFQPYKDGNGLYAPAPVPPGVMRGSDNGPLFTSEVMLIRFEHVLATAEDIDEYDNVIKTCVDSNGNLHRAPGDTTEDAPDDYYGVAAAYSQLHMKSNIKLPFSLWRQPQLLFAIMASNQTLSRWKFWQWPLAIYSALVVLTSCIGTDSSNTDARILAWLLIKATSDHSILVKLASNIWFNRLYATYPNGMNDVAGIYFQPQGTGNNPYSIYWVTK